MLTDTKIRSLKPTGKLYKVTDRDGLYVAVTAGGAISFRYNYRINGRQETLTIGAYGIGGITLAEAREKQLAAKKLVQEGISPAREKIRAKSRDEGPGSRAKRRARRLQQGGVPGAAQSDAPRLGQHDRFLDQSSLKRGLNYPLQPSSSAS